MSSVQRNGDGQQQRSASVGSVEWEMLDEGLSVSSFSSGDESEGARIIFGEVQRNNQRRIQQQALSAATMFEGASATASPQAQQQLMDKITQLAEDLNDSQEQSKLLLLQNQRLSAENQELKTSLQQLVQKYSNSSQGGLFDGDLKTTAMAVASGIVMMTLLKKRIMIGSVNVIGGVALAGVTASLWSLWQNLQPDNKNEDETQPNESGPKPLKLKLQHQVL